MKFSSLILLTAITLGSQALADMSILSDAPAAIERTSYLNWSHSIGSADSAFYNNLMDWYGDEKARDLPAQVAQDPDSIYVNVDRPLQETKALEDSGDIEVGVTYGLEIYAKIPANISQVLETTLYRWGKPIGQAQGTTYPYDALFSARVEKMEVKWGPGSYMNYSKKSGGGIAKDINDAYSLLVRGSADTGYDLIGQFSRPNGPTTTTSSMSIITLRPLKDGTTAYKLSARHTGQSYTFLGNVEIGRRNFGFNSSKVRQGQKDFENMVDELKRTGTIKDRN